MQITVANIYGPKEGRKTGSIKTTDGRWLDIWPDKAAGVAQGQTYEVTTSQRDYNGKTYYTIQTIKPVQQDWQAPPQQGHNNPPPARTGEVPPILSNVLAHAIGGGHVRIEDLPRLASLVAQSVQAYQTQIDNRGTYQQPVGGPPPADPRDYGYGPGEEPPFGP